MINKEVIVAALNSNNGNVLKTAQALKMTRWGVYKYMEKFEIKIKKIAY
jgi:transcriptional regulator with GAF, ATPase, and Fis domain